MAVTPLTKAQHVAVDALVSGGRLDKVQANAVRAGNFVQQAEDALADVPNQSLVPAAQKRL